VREKKFFRPVGGGEGRRERERERERERFKLASDEE